MAKKLNVKTKLKKDIAPDNGQVAIKSPTTTERVSKKLTLKNYRLRWLDVQRLDKILKETNAVSNTNLCETDIIKGLIYLGTKTKKERIIKAFKDSL